MIKWLIIGILVLGLGLRLYQIASVPPALFADEASIGYNAYTIATLGQDEFGVPWPIFFRAFGEYKGPVQIYTTALFVKIGGLSESTVRLPSALFGTLTIWAVFLLVRQLFISRSEASWLAVGAAMCLAISPWHIHMSRISFEGLMPFVLFTTLGTYCYLRIKDGAQFVWMMMLCFVVALYSYFPARIFMPIYAGTLVLVSAKKILAWSKTAVLVGAVGVVLMWPLASSLLSGSGLARWKQVSIFENPPQNQSAWEHVIHNYLSHFSWEFLFSRGDIDMPGQFITRHSVRGLGELYIWQAPLILFGVFWLKKTPGAAGILVLWLLLYPLGSAFTQDRNAQATRSIIGVIPWQILTVSGVAFLLEQFNSQSRKKIVLALLVFVSVISIWRFGNLYFHYYPKYSADYWGWQYGQKQIVQYFVTQAPFYQDLITSGEANGPEIFFKFFDLKKQCRGKCRLGDVSTQPELVDPNRMQLFAIGAGKIDPVRFKQLKQTIYYPSGLPAFYIGEL